MLYEALNDVRLLVLRDEAEAIRLGISFDEN